MSFEYHQIFESIDLGLVIVDTSLRVIGWNSWMERHSGISSLEISGSSLVDRFTNLAEPKYSRMFRSVLNFGNYACFSQKLHSYLIPLKNPHQSVDLLPYMQQNCTANPVRDEQGHITGLYITIQDVTEYVTYEQKLIEMTKLDPLTRLFNRSYLAKRLVEELERFRRYGTTFSVILIDIDYFKKINDTMGHQCGDKTLCTLAGMLQCSVRTMDVVARYGGEEFCCLLPETGAENAVILAERLRSVVETTIFKHGNDEFAITISIGVAECRASSITQETLVGYADAALYRAKHEGRNRVVCAGDRPASSDDTMGSYGE